MPGQPSGGKEYLVRGLIRCLPLVRVEARSLAAALSGSSTQIVPGDLDLAKLFGDVLRSWKGASPLDQLLARTCVLRILTQIAMDRQQVRGAGPTSLSDAELRVRAFLERLESRCDEEWTLPLMAAAAGLKRSRFGALCRRLTAESPTTYLTRLRIRLARRLLRETNRTVTEIALQCGFGSSQYFAKTFRRYQGHEPTHYRAVCREMSGRSGIHYIKGDSAHIVAYADRHLGAGDFIVEAKISLDRIGGTAASLELGHDRFGFDGSTGRLFLEGDTCGGTRLLGRSTECIPEGVPFQLTVRRSGQTLSIRVNGKPLARVADDPRRAIGKVGFRPMRNGIHVESLRINGEDAVLVSPDLA